MSEIITNKDLDYMCHHIKMKMKFDKWYPVKTDKAFDAIIILINKRCIDEVEFNTKQLYIRKINLNFKNTSLYGDYFKRREQKANSGL